MIELLDTYVQFLEATGHRAEHAALPGVLDLDTEALLTRLKFLLPAIPWTRCRRNRQSTDHHQSRQCFRLYPSAEASVPYPFWSDWCDTQLRSAVGRWTTGPAANTTGHDKGIRMKNKMLVSLAPVAAVCVAVMGKPSAQAASGSTS